LNNPLQPFHRRKGSEAAGEKPSHLLNAATWTASRVAAGLQNLRGNLCGDGFGILMYHRVTEHFVGAELPTVNVTPSQLRRQLTGLLARGFVAWPLSEIVRAHNQSRHIPSNVFAVTFDDGYENNYLNAWPILQELNIPATIYITTKYLGADRPFPFDRWSATGTSRVPPSAWRPLTTSQCDEMLNSGLIELGAHTHSHERFLGRSDEFRADLRLCLDVLQNRFGIDRPTFAFPFGDTSLELVQVAKQLGVSCCVTTRRRRVRSGDDPFRWGRFGVQPIDTAATLAAKLSGWYEAVVTMGKTLTFPLATLARVARRRSSIYLAESPLPQTTR
jgi:peptidoglycan/xylan/chitin deacetylase (PgdA/CDA1 family)